MINRRAGWFPSRTVDRLAWWNMRGSFLDGCWVAREQLGLQTDQENFRDSIVWGFVAGARKNACRGLIYYQVSIAPLHWPKGLQHEQGF